MGSIIAIATSKGGGGKTALTSCLAVNLAVWGYRVHVVDSDANQAFAYWWKNTYEGPPLTCSSEISHQKIVGHVMAAARQADVVLVDTAGFANQTAAFAMGAADFVLIPCMPDRNSALEALRTVETLQSLAQVARRELLYRVVLMRWDPRRLADRAALEDLEQAHLPRLSAYLADTTAFGQFTFSGAMPTSGRIGRAVDRVIEELQALEALPSVAAV